MKKGKQTTLKLITVVDDSVKLPDKQGNGIIRILVKQDNCGKTVRYSFAYINPHLFSEDNGRVLGYDNSHGYHHRHYMGQEESVEFKGYEKIIERFEREWRALHEKVKNKKRS